MLLLFFGCADDLAVLSALAPELDPVAADALMRGDALDDWGLHTYVSGGGAARLRDGGDAFTDGRALALGQRFPVIDADEGVRLLARQGNVRTLLWVDRSELLDVVAETVWVDAEGRPVRGSEAGIRLTAGTAVEWADGGAWAPVRGYSVNADVPLSGALVDQLWVEDTEAAVADAFAPLLGAELRVRADTTFRDDRGRVLLQLEGEHDVGVADAAVLAEDPERGTLVLANVGRDELVRGWVEPDALGAVHWIGFGSSWSCGGCWGSWGHGVSNPEVLPRGTVLFAAPEGEVIGITERTVTLNRRGDVHEGWVAVDAPTPWGTGRLWARHPDDSPSDADRDAEQDAFDLGMDIELREVDAWAWPGGDPP